MLYEVITNRKQFELLPGSQVTFKTELSEGVWFCGKYLDDTQWRYLFNAVVISGDHLLIFTGISDESTFEEKRHEMEQLVKQIHSPVKLAGR